MKIVVAVDKFKGSITAGEAAEQLAAGLTADRDDLEVVSVPVADGGDGTLAAAQAAGWASVPVRVNGPTGEPIATTIAVQDSAAVVELAATCGLELLPNGILAAVTASSEGAGQAMAHALDTGCREIILGLGGSASTDAGAGLLTALGARILNARGQQVCPGGAGLADASYIDLEPALERTAGAKLVIASDVNNPLTGSNGAAAVYGPQKGADPEQVRILDAALNRFASLVREAGGPDVSQQPGSGAAGGAGYAAYLLGGRFRQGIEIVLDLVRLDAHLADADLVITGEGSLDEQSLHGKAPIGVARAAARHGIPVVAIAGQIKVDSARLHQAGIQQAYALTDLSSDVQECIDNAGPMLRRLAQFVVIPKPPGARH